MVKKTSTAKFDEAIDLSLQINLKQGKTEFNMRTMVNLPSGTGKRIKIAVVCEESKVNEVTKLGADLVGSDNLIKEISNGKINFDKLISTPAMKLKLGKLGKILGPKGLMPNPKLGTVTQDISSAVQKGKTGQVQFKNDKSGIVHAGIGKLDSKEEALFENLKVFYDAVLKSKSDNIKKSKGSFVPELKRTVLKKKFLLKRFVMILVIHLQLLSLIIQVLMLKKLKILEKQ